MGVYVWLYRSYEAQKTSTEQLMDILAVSRRHNGSTGITGMLLYDQCRFTQIIEGGQSDILALKDRILADRRHKDITTVYEGEENERVFAHWSMAFLRPNLMQQLQLESYMALPWARKTLETINMERGIAPALLEMSAWISDPT